MTIRFASHDFDGPYLAASWLAPSCGGVYAVLVRDPHYKPLPYRVIDFGQAADFAAEAPLSRQRKYPQWLAAAADPWGLYVATHRMPGATELLRVVLERFLLRHYRPQCHQACGAEPALARPMRTYKEN